jgi:hypothetical protein
VLLLFVTLVVTVLPHNPFLVTLQIRVALGNPKSLPSFLPSFLPSVLMIVYVSVPSSLLHAD